MNKTAFSHILLYKCCGSYSNCLCDKCCRSKWNSLCVPGGDALNSQLTATLHFFRKRTDTSGYLTHTLYNGEQFPWETPSPAYFLSLLSCLIWKNSQRIWRVKFTSKQTEISTIMHSVMEHFRARVTRPPSTWLSTPREISPRFLQDLEWGIPRAFACSVNWVYL